VRLGRNRRVDNARRVFFLVFIIKDNFMIVDNCYGIAVAPLFFVKCIQYPPLCFFAQLGLCHMVFKTKHVPLRPGNHCALLGQHSWFLAEPIGTLFSISVTWFSIPVRLVCL